MTGEVSGTQKEYEQDERRPLSIQSSLLNSMVNGHGPSEAKWWSRNRGKDAGIGTWICLYVNRGKYVGIGTLICLYVIITG